MAQVVEIVTVTDEQLGAGRVWTEVQCHAWMNTKEEYFFTIALCAIEELQQRRAADRRERGDEERSANEG